MFPPPPRYRSGARIRPGDSIAYAGHPGRVVWVWDDAHPEPDWEFLGRGCMIEAEGYGWVHLDPAEQQEDLVLIERGEV